MDELISDERYLSMIDRKFGTKAVEYIRYMTSQKLPRGPHEPTYTITT